MESSLFLERSPATTEAIASPPLVRGKPEAAVPDLSAPETDPAIPRVTGSLRHRVAMWNIMALSNWNGSPSTNPSLIPYDEPPSDTLPPACSPLRDTFGARIRRAQEASYWHTYNSGQLPSVTADDPFRTDKPLQKGQPIQEKIVLTPLQEPANPQIQFSAARRGVPRRIILVDDAGRTAAHRKVIEDLKRAENETGWPTTSQWLDEQGHPQEQVATNERKPSKLDVVRILAREALANALGSVGGILSKLPQPGIVPLSPTAANWSRDTGPQTSAAAIQAAYEASVLRYAEVSARQRSGHVGFVAVKRAIVGSGEQWLQDWAKNYWFRRSIEADEERESVKAEWIRQLHYFMDTRPDLRRDPDTANRFRKEQLVRLEEEIYKQQILLINPAGPEAPLTRRERAGTWLAEQVIDARPVGSVLGVGAGMATHILGAAGGLGATEIGLPGYITSAAITALSTAAGWFLGKKVAETANFRAPLTYEGCDQILARLEAVRTAAEDDRVHLTDYGVAAHIDTATAEIVAQNKRRVKMAGAVGMFTVGLATLSGSLLGEGLAR